MLEYVWLACMHTFIIYNLFLSKADTEKLS